MDRLLKVVAIIGILLVSGSISYYFFIFAPSQSVESIKAERNAEQRRILKVQYCQKFANHKMVEYVKEQVELPGEGYIGTLEDAKPYLDKYYKELRDECFHKYNIK